MATPSFTVQKSKPAATVFLKVYPNPVSGNQVALQYRMVQKGLPQVSITNMTGHTVLHQRLPTYSTGLQQTAFATLQLPNLPAGLYLIHLANGREVLINKLVVTK